MIKKLIPLVLVFVGVGAGVGAGIFLRPDVPIDVSETGTEQAEDADHSNKESANGHDGDDDEEVGANEYVKLSNQFVVPIVRNERVTALVVLALSLEIPAGQTDTVLSREPKLRDSFLQILFDHANIGGFQGNFTDAQVLGRLRMALREVAQRDLGRDLAKDVLIVEIARQDY
jgi:hypothetical protein